MENYVKLMVLIALLVSGIQIGLAAAPPVGGYGEERLENVIQDRPQMGPSIEIRPAVRKWIIERLDQTVPPIDWDPSPPISGRGAEFDATNPETTWVRVSPKLSGIDQLSVVRPLDRPRRLVSPLLTSRT